MRKILLAPVGADNPEAPCESPGILTALVLEAALRGAKIHSDLFFYFNEQWPTARKRLLEQAKQKQYDVIGLSFMSYNRLEAHDLLRDLAIVVPRCHIIVGGVHATFLYEQILREFPNVSAVAIGEGEQSLAAFCRCSDDLESIPGIAYRNDAGKVQVNPPSPQGRQDLDLQPIVNYKLLGDYQGSIPLQTSRGCAARCVFCAWKAMEGTVKTKSPERILEEWATIREIFGPNRRIVVFDACYNISLKHVKTMCQALIDANFTSNPWDVEVRATPVDREMLEMMKKAGCKRLLIGVETGNEQIRKNIGKNVSNKDIQRIFALGREIKMPTFPFIITGLPGETDETVTETIEFIRALKPYYCPSSVPAMAFPGARLYEVMKERGQIGDDYWLYKQPKNLGDIEACANLPLYTAEQNMVQIMKWFSLHYSEAIRMSNVPQERLILDDEEYDRHDPWRTEQKPLRLQELWGRNWWGMWRMPARRIARRIRTRMEIAPRRLYAGQTLTISIYARVHRLADVYLLLSHPGGTPTFSIIGVDRGFTISEKPTPLIGSVPGNRMCYWTVTLPTHAQTTRPGRYSLLLVVCGAGEPLFDRKNWLDWRKSTIVVRLHDQQTEDETCPGETNNGT